MSFPVGANAVGLMNRMRTSPIPVQRTSRTLMHRTLTSMNAGFMTPIMAIPLLREDSVTRGQFRFAFQMEETVEILMNAINVRLMAYLVPKLAFDRYDGLDSLNKSYEGIPLVDGGAVTPWFEMVAAPDMSANLIYKSLGKHARTGDQINTDYIEAYNQIWNFRARNRSQDIPLRTRLDSTLAKAFWQHQTFAHIVPDFDQALIDGAVPLQVIPPGTANWGRAKVDGLAANGAAPNGPKTGVDADGLINYATGYSTQTGTGDDAVVLRTKTNAANAPLDVFVDVGKVFEEMVADGISISLSNIELARKTQAFANLRRQYAGHSDEHIIDLLMDGISIPDQAWKQPMLLADVSTVFGMSKRWASDSPNLTESVVNGATAIDISFSVPRCNPGGVVMIVAEIAPEQLFERQRDPYLHAGSVDDLPQFLRDTLDPEKVEVVPNDAIDIDHDTPDGVFGYAPLNWEWAKSMPQIGGKFYRPKVDGAFDEDRQRIWAVETINPTLSADFYLVSSMNYKPFVITATTTDHFECLGRGGVTIMGNTVFGPLLVEAEDDYAKVFAEAPTDRIVKPAAVSRQEEQSGAAGGATKAPPAASKKK